MINKRNSGVLVLLVLYVLLGFFREFLFVNINEQMRVTYYHVNDSQLAPSLRFLENYSYDTLYYSKWPLTFLFAGIFCAMACGVIHLLFQERRLLRWTILSYAVVFVIGWGFYLVGKSAGEGSFGYTIARFLAGMTESPILLIVLIASFGIVRRSSD